MQKNKDKNDNRRLSILKATGIKEMKKKKASMGKLKWSQKKKIIT